MKHFLALLVSWIAYLRSTRGWVVPPNEFATPDRFSSRLFSQRRDKKQISDTSKPNILQGNAPRDHEAISRRMMFATSLFTAGSTLGAATSSAISSEANAITSQPPISFYAPDSKLIWEPTPINKRTGITVFDAESFGYNVQ